MYRLATVFGLASIDPPHRVYRLRLFMRKLNKGKEAKELAKTVVRLLMPYKKFIKTITTDNGLEFACHEYITKKLGITVYFTDPYSS